MEIQGKIVAREIVDLKFQIGGKLNVLSVKAGDQVKKGQLLASLDKTELQAYLDRALKTYDLERAGFDEKQKQNLTPYEQRKYQDELDISVKNVEIAKANLDGTDLFAPMDGFILSMGNATPGVNITPSGFVITLLSPSSLCFQGELKEEDFSKINYDGSVKIVLKAFPDKTYDGKVEKIGLSALKDGIFPIFVTLTDTFNLRIGMTAKAIN